MEELKSDHTLPIPFSPREDSALGKSESPFERKSTNISKRSMMPDECTVEHLTIEPSIDIEIEDP